MTTAPHKNWQSFWNAQKEPLHSSDSQEFYDRHALELQALIGQPTPSSVLEIGCGTGAFYERLGFDHGQYKGVDFAQSMLSVFAQDYPDVRLECADGSEFRDDCKYRLVFSNGVLQYFDRPMLRRHFANVRQMMDSDSVFVCASIPWKSQRARFITGELFPPYRRDMLRVAKECARFLLGRGDQLGHWYGFPDLRRLAEENGMVATMYTSVCYVYRFHAVMKLR